MARENRAPVDVMKGLEMRKPYAPKLSMGPTIGRIQNRPRQDEVFEALLTSLSPKEIATNLGMSEQTIKNHCMAIYDIHGVNSRIELMYKFMERSRCGEVCEALEARCILPLGHSGTHRTDKEK